MSLAGWLRSRCARTCQLTLCITPDRKLESLVALLAPRLEYAELLGTCGGNVEQAPIEQLAIYGSSRLAEVVLLTSPTPRVQLDPLAGLAGLRTLHVNFDDETNDIDGPPQPEPFPFSLCGLSQLTRLELTYNKIRLLPNALSCLAALQQLVVIGSDRGDVYPNVAAKPGLGRMRSLTHLTLEACTLPAAWPSLSGLTALAELTFEECACAEGGLPAGCCAAPALRKLTCRCVRSCGLDHVQPGELRALTSLTLAACGLRDFPAVICQLRGLVELDLIGNDFDLMPRSISQLANLRELYLNSEDALPRLLADARGSHCHSLFLPVELAKLPKLRRLDLRNTAFTLEASLGRGLADNTSLTSVCMYDSLPSKQGVRELVLLGSRLQEQGRFAVLSWSPF